MLSEHTHYDPQPASMNVPLSIVVLLQAIIKRDLRMSAVMLLQLQVQDFTHNVVIFALD